MGTIHSAAALKEAVRLRKGEVDLLELRLDHFVTDLKPLIRVLPKLAIPLIVTVRHPREGGVNRLSSKQRLSLYRQFLPFAAMIDVELRSAASLEPLLEEAHNAGVLRILSWHDFRSTPSLPVLRSRWPAAAEFQPEVIKFATVTEKPTQLATLIAFLAGRPAQPLASVMGMRTFGKVSRLALAAAGSHLNYGYLGELQVPGQWPAKALKRLLAEVLS